MKINKVLAWKKKNKTEIKRSETLIPSKFDYLFDFDSDNFDSQSFENSDSNAITAISATSQDTSINALQLAAI